MAGMDNELADLLAKFDKPIESKPKPEQSSLQAMLVSLVFQ